MVPNIDHGYLADKNLNYDLFALTNPSYRTAEINYLLENCSKIPSTPIQIENLLIATKNFRNATKIDMFSEITQTASDEKLNTIFHKIKIALETFQTYLSQINDAPQKKLFISAFDYCRTSIEQRLNQLKAEGDKLYQLYLSEQNLNLKKIIEEGSKL